MEKPALLSAGFFYSIGFDPLSIACDHDSDWEHEPPGLL
jgi:hypothetical protein